MVPNGVGCRELDILSDEWWVMSDENRVMSDGKKKSKQSLKVPPFWITYAWVGQICLQSC